MPLSFHQVYRVESDVPGFSRPVATGLANMEGNRWIAWSDPRPMEEYCGPAKVYRFQAVRMRDLEAGSVEVIIETQPGTEIVQRYIPLTADYVVAHAEDYALTREDETRIRQPGFFYLYFKGFISESYLRDFGEEEDAA